MSLDSTLGGQHWRGYGSLKHIVVFGASYCDVGYDPDSPHPCKERPLGVDFPGVTFAEPGEPNWVGYLTRDHSPSGNFEADPLLVYDYGMGGHTVTGVKNQVELLFVPLVGQKPEWAPWSAEDTLFITWVGINDCGNGADPVKAMQTLFAAQETLYTKGARNFMLVEVPPMLRSPLGVAPGTFTYYRYLPFIRLMIVVMIVAVLAKRGGDPFQNWNTQLRSSALAFDEVHEDAIVMVFPAWDLFNAVLDDPVQYGFASDDSRKIGGGIWVDRLHPTTKMHKIIAQGMVDYLKTIAPIPAKAE